VSAVGFQFICDKAAVYDNALHTGTPGCIDQPADGLHLRLAEFRLLPESSGDFLQRGTVNTRRQVAIVVAVWDHEIPCA